VIIQGHNWKATSYATFFPDQRRNKKLVGPATILSLFSISLLLQTVEMGCFSPVSLVSISLVSKSIEPNTLLHCVWMIKEIGKREIVKREIRGREIRERWSGNSLLFG
jgi:hypothetical protein